MAFKAGFALVEIMANCPLSTTGETVRMKQQHYDDICAHFFNILTGNTTFATSRLRRQTPRALLPQFTLFERNIGQSSYKKNPVNIDQKHQFKRELPGSIKGQIKGVPKRILILEHIISFSPKEYCTKKAPRWVRTTGQ